MSVIGSNALAGASGQVTGGGGTTSPITRSVRLNSGDSADLERTFQSGGNRTKWTWSAWIKRNTLSTSGAQRFFAVSGAGNTNDDWFSLFFFNDQLRIGGYSAIFRQSTMLFRDTSAWMHLVCVVDLATSPYITIYVNGQSIELTGSTNPSQTGINAARPHYIGSEANNNYTDLQIADVHFLDGIAANISDLGALDSDNVWQKVAYTGSYGTTGFHLDFEDNSSLSNLTADAAGSNDWTFNNGSITAGADNDSLMDCPFNGSQTDSGAGGELSGNYASLLPINTSAGTLSDANLKYSLSAVGAARGSFMVSSGKWYFEVKLTTSGNPYVGIAGEGQTVSGGAGYVSPNALAVNSDGDVYLRTGGSTSYPGKSVSMGAGVIGIAMDVDNKKVWFSKNGTWYKFGSTKNSSTTVSQVEAGNFGADFSSLTGDFFTVHLGSSTSNNTTFEFNAGARPFAYNAPSGYKCLCSSNLTATIADGSKHFDAKLYNGSGSNQNITGLNFEPSFTWLKARNHNTWHVLNDAVRGAGKNIYSNDSYQEVTKTDNLTSFNSDGFSLGADSNSDGVNISGKTYVSWNWAAGSSTVTNTDGSISAQVRANPSAGFSILTYTGSGANNTIGHGLSAAPEMIWVKRRNSAENWGVYHVGIGNGNRLTLDQTAAAASTTTWNNTTPTSSVFSVGVADLSNGNNDTYVAYCFTSVEGYSSVGSYSGNGNSDGTFVYTGMRPAWLLVKKTNATESWILHDTARSPYNVSSDKLSPNSSGSEGSSTFCDFLSNGFKLRTSTSGEGNDSGSSYIYIAFAENPFKTSRAR